MIAAESANPLRGGIGTALRQLSLPDLAVIASIALGMRALNLLVAAATRFGSAPDGRLGSQGLPSLLVGWDAYWYLRIAQTGYAPISTLDELTGTAPHAYFPAYPLTIRALIAATGLDPATAGVLISTVLFVGALCLIHVYVRDLGQSREVGFAAILLVSCAPHSFLFVAAYAESMFMFLLAAALLALRRGAYVLAGLAAALLSATRPNGYLVVVFVLAWTLQTHGWRALLRPWAQPGPLLVLAMAPLGLVAYWWFCFVTTGDAFAQKTAVTHGWHWAADWPWTNLARHLTSSSTDRFWAWGSLIYFAASFLLLRFRMVAEFAFCCASFLLFWINVMPASMVRYAVVLFPIFIGIARACTGRPLLLAAVAAGLATINGLLTAAFVLGWRIAV